MIERRKRPRLSIEVDSELRRRLKIAAARRDVTIRDYVLAAVEHMLESEDSADWSALSEPVFARDWNTPADAAYDRL